MPTATYTQSAPGQFQLVCGRPWSLPVTLRQPAPSGQCDGSGTPVDLTGASASCNVVWQGGSIACAMATLDVNGAPVPSLTASQTATVPAGPAWARLTITDTAGNTYDFALGLKVITP